MYGIARSANRAWSAMGGPYAQGLTTPGSYRGAAPGRGTRRDGPVTRRSRPRTADRLTVAGPGPGADSTHATLSGGPLMRWKTFGIAAGVLLVGAVLAACRPVTPPATPPPTVAPPTTAPPGLPGLTSMTWASPPLDGTIQGRPLFVADPSLANGIGVVVVATENDSVYGLNPVDGTVLWGPKSIGTAEPLSQNDAAGTGLSGCGDIDPLGITSSPVLDNGHVYVVGERETSTLVSGNHVPEHVTAGPAPATGRFVLSPTNIDPSAMTDTSPSPSPTTNQVEGEQQRTGLEAVNGQVYVGFGGLSGDCGPYHGFIVDVNESNGGIAGYFESATSTSVPNDREGAVWAPGGMAVNTADSTLYASTGNSQDFTPPPTDED